MRKMFLVLLVLIMMTGVVFAGDKKETTFQLPKYTTADKVAITVVTATIATIVTIVAKEVIVDGAYGVRK